MDFNCWRTYFFLSNNTATTTSTTMTSTAPINEYVITSEVVATVTGIAVGALVGETGAFATTADVSAYELP